MKYIKLTQGGRAFVDDEDYELVKKWKWTNSKGYATRQRYISYINGKQTNKLTSMHREILEHHGINLYGREVDHINGNPRDNRKQNLRPCNRSQNIANARLKNNKNGFRGIAWHSKNGTWQVRIHVNNRSISLGYYADKIEAARAYDVAARKYFGEFARTNL